MMLTAQSLKYAVSSRLTSDADVLRQIHETVETINQLKTNRDFFLGFAKNPQEFINSWLVSQTRDLKASRC